MRAWRTKCSGGRIEKKKDTKKKAVDVWMDLNETFQEY